MHFYVSAPLDIGSVNEYEAPKNIKTVDLYESCEAYLPKKKLAYESSSPVTLFWETIS